MRTKFDKVEFIRMLFAILISLTLVFAIIFLVSSNPIGAIKSFVLGPIKSIRRIGNVIELMIPLSMSGLAIIFLFKTGLFNLSAEGAIFSGSAVSAIVALTLDFPPIIVLILSILAGGLIGALITFIPGFLKIKTGASEIVTSLMLNFVCLHISLYFIQEFFLDKTINSSYTYKFREGISLGNIIPGTRIHFGLVIVLIFILLSYFLLKKTTFGVKADLVGSNANMSKYSGIDGTKIIIATQLIGGFIAGIGGSIELFGMYNRFQYGDLTGYGWEGIPIAIIAKNNPKLLPFAALFISYLRIGADIMSRETDIPFEIVQIIQAIMIVFISANALLSSYKKRMLAKEINKIGEINE